MIEDRGLSSEVMEDTSRRGTGIGRRDASSSRLATSRGCYSVGSRSEHHIMNRVLAQSMRVFAVVGSMSKNMRSTRERSASPIPV